MNYKIKSYDKNLRVAKSKVQYTSRPHKYSDVKLLPTEIDKRKVDLRDTVKELNQKLEQLENDLSVMKLNEKFKQKKQYKNKFQFKELSYEPIHYNVSSKQEYVNKLKKKKTKKSLKQQISKENLFYLSFLSSLSIFILFGSFYVILLVVRNQFL